MYCCRLTQNGRCPVTDKCLRLFVATRVFPSYLPNDGYICAKCCSMYNKWKTLPEFHDILMMINGGHEATNTTTDNVRSEATSNDEWMDSENCSDQLVNATSSDNESMGDNQTVDGSSGDDQSVDDTTSDDHVKDGVVSSGWNS